MVHRWDDEVPLDETLHALHEVVASGRAQAIGCSNFTGEQLSEALEISRRNGWSRIEIVENIYNLARPEEEQSSMPVCERQQVTFLAFSPLGAGFLTGKYTGDRGRLPAGTRFDVAPAHCDVYFSDRNFRLVERLRAKATELGDSMAYLAGAWTVSNPSVGSTLFGARSTAQVDNALRCLQDGIDAGLRAEMANWR